MDGWERWGGMGSGGVGIPPLLLLLRLVVLPLLLILLISSSPFLFLKPPTKTQKMKMFEASFVNKKCSKNDHRGGKVTRRGFSAYPDPAYDRF